jgi:hypothetical protein
MTGSPELADHPESRKPLPGLCRNYIADDALTGRTVGPKYPIMGFWAFSCSLYGSACHSALPPGRVHRLLFNVLAAERCSR